MRKIRSRRMGREGRFPRKSVTVKHVAPRNGKGRYESPTAKNPDERNPKPAPAQDPPAEPEQAPYVVRGQQAGQLRESRIANEAPSNPGERKERRGFASMSPEKQREIASKEGVPPIRRGRLTSGPPRKPAPRAARGPDQPRRPWPARRCSQSGAGACPGFHDPRGAVSTR